MAEREAPGERGPSEAASSADEEDVLTLTCFKCGTEYYLSEPNRPEQMRCEKCGNTVFRSFYTAEGDEAADDFRETTERDLDPDDPEGDALPGDVLDLNRD